MKPFSSLTAVVSPVSQQANGDGVVSPSLSPPLEIDANRLKISSSKTSEDEQAIMGNSNNESSSMSSRRQQPTDKLDRKLIKAGFPGRHQGIFKLSSLNLLTNGKVGSSFTPNQGNANYRRDSASLNVMILPVTNRKVRDSSSLLLMLAFLGFLGYIIWDSVFVKEVDINLIVHGHDSYGNICGRNNKPISYAEKSGKNYTSKPYTKYTLINAQFERYTLDSNRLKQGELFYIKQVDSSADDDISGDGVEYSTEQRTRGGLVKAEKRGIRLIRDALETDQGADEDQFASVISQDGARNQTLLRHLKLNLMYHYPPTYNHNSTRSTVPLNGGFKDSITVRDRVANLEHDAKLGGVRTTLNEQSNLSYQAISSNPIDQMGRQRVSLLANSSNPRSTTSSPMQVAFDDHTSSDGDRYEHVMLNSTAHQQRTSIIHGLDSSEVSGQLLYLTECVDHCPSNHVELIFYRCMPHNWRFSLFPTAINVTQTFIDDILTDISHCYRELIYIFSLALFLSLALLILLRFLASLIIWSCLAMVISLITSLASYSWLNYYQQVVDLNHLMPHDSYYAERVATTDKWLVGSIFLTFIAFATVGLVIFMRRRILLVTTLFRESGKAIADMPLLLIQPILTFAVLVLLTFIWGLGLICLQSVKNPVLDVQTGFIVFKSDVLYKVMKWYHIFAFLWVSHFAIACQHYVIGASVSKWYFSENRYDLNSPIGSSVSELILYYLGSVALGSFLVAIFKVIRIITKQIQFLVQRNCMTNPNGGSHSLDSPEMNSNHVSGSCCGTFGYVWRLFMWFFDNIVMIINRDAYVEIAIHGHSFLSGAQRALKILASNPLKLLAIKSVSNILLIVAKICVVFGTVSMAMILLEEKNHQLNYSWSPVVISAIYSYVVAHWFLSVYEMVIDALFICYCEDYERSKSQETINQINNSNIMAQILNSSQFN